MSPQLALPTLDNLRLATFDDLPRIVVVAAAGFFHSPTFRFTRPYHADYPQDTLASYRTEYHGVISDPSTLVLVSEDEWHPDEIDAAYEALRGAAGIVLDPRSGRIGLFQTGDPGALKLYGETTAPVKANAMGLRYLEGRMRLSTLAVHPFYWRRGHATRLVSWCTRLADVEDVSLGISAAPMGAVIAAKAGFEGQETIRINPSTVQDREMPFSKDVELWVAIRQPSRSPSDTSTESSNSPITE